MNRVELGGRPPVREAARLTFSRALLRGRGTESRPELRSARRVHMTTSKRIAISYSQAGDAEGAGRRREAEHRIPWEPWGGVVRRSGRTFKPRVRGSSPRAGTTFCIQIRRLAPSMNCPPYSPGIASSGIYSLAIRTPDSNSEAAVYRTAAEHRRQSGEAIRSS